MLAVPNISQKPRCSSGFTLIELLVAMLLMGLVAMVVFDGLRLGTRVVTAVDARVEISEQIRQLHRFLRMQLQQIHTFTNNKTKEETPVLFSGNKTSMSFAAPMPEYSQKGGIYWFTIAFEQGEDVNKLVLDYKLAHMDKDSNFNKESGEKIVLYEGRDNIEFSYGRKNYREYDWLQNWQDAGSLPTVIRLQIKTGDENVQNWPELIVHPRSKGGASSKKIFQ